MSNSPLRQPHELEQQQQLDDDDEEEGAPSASSSLSSGYHSTHDGSQQQKPPGLVASSEPQQQPLQQPLQQHAGGGEGSSCHSLSYAYQTYLKHDQQEQNHWQDVCRSYRQYATFAMEQWVNHQYRLHSLSEDHRRFLPAALRQETLEFQQRATAYKDAAIRNQFCLDCILRHAGQKHSQQQQTITESAGVATYSTDAQMSKVSSVLKSLARDWSTDGKPERDMAYQPLLQRVRKYLPVRTSTTTTATNHETTLTTTTSLPPQRICVPGSGVGRLACELSAAGYHTVQGNEFSLFMLLASDFVLNGPLSPATPLSISPWMLESRNVHTVADQLRIVRIPDVDPYDMIMNDHSSSSSNNTATAGATGGAPESSSATTTTSGKTKSPPDFSMAAGEFVSIYGSDRERGQWDAVVACFFLDASPSIVEYLQVIHQMLRPGGYLFHFGPLLWHWSGPAMRPDDKSVHDYRERYNYLDAKYLSSIDLTWEDMREIIINMGFEIVESSTGHQALYTADRRSMMNMHYKCIQFVARKPLHSGGSSDGDVNPTAAAASEVAMDVSMT